MIAIKETNLAFETLEVRDETNRIILHHSGEIDRDFSAAEIHQMHINKHWSGIGYHFVIRKNGLIERGRPLWAVGAHTQDNNGDSIGVNIAGDFDLGTPTDAQIESLTALICRLCAQFCIPIDDKSLLAHCDLMPTACPGRHLYEKLPEIRNQAARRLAAENRTVLSRKESDETLCALSAKYESDGNPAAVSGGGGDLGGISYGIYQLSSGAGSVQSFLSFACTYPNRALANYGVVLSRYSVNSGDFINEWKSIGTIDPAGFSQLQNAYAKSTYYDTAANDLRNAYYDIQTKSRAMQAVLFSRSVQYGSGNMVELYANACARLGHPNLSYVNSDYFDRQMIAAIYDFLIEECDNAYQLPSGLYHSPNDWANGSRAVVKIGLKNRFVNEKSDALAML